MAASNPCTLTEVASDADFATTPTTSQSRDTGHLLPCPPMGRAMQDVHCPVYPGLTYTATFAAHHLLPTFDAEELSDVSEHYDVTRSYIVIQKAGKVLDTISGGDALARAAVEKTPVLAGQRCGLGLPPAQLVNKPEGANAKNLSAMHLQQTTKVPLLSTGFRSQP